MTYYYKIRGIINRKEGGSPPDVDEYIAIGKDSVVRHIKNDEVIEQKEIMYPEHVPYLASKDTGIKELYKKASGYIIAKDMLTPMARKKKTTQKLTKRKTKRR